MDTRLFSLTDPPTSYAPLGPLAHPVSLFVGRLSYEKNIDAFLRHFTLGQEPASAFDAVSVCAS